MAYKISEAGIAVLKQGADPSVESNWNLILSFTGETTTEASKANIGPSEARTIISRDAAGVPKISGVDSGGVSLPLLRQQSGTIAVVASKDIHINFTQPFAKIPRVTVILDQSSTTQPWRIATTKTGADLKLANNFTGNIDYVALEPGD